MEATIIYLGRPLPNGSSDQPERAPGKGCSLRCRVPLGLAPDGVYQEQGRPCSSWSLTPRFHPCLICIPK